MSPAEVVWRIEERLSLAWLEARSGREAPALARPAGGWLAAFRASSAVLRPPGERAAFAARLAAAVPGETERLAAQAVAVRGGDVELFARRYALGSDPSAWPWNRSPDGGPEVALEFGPTLDYRAPARVGNARLAWEFARAPWSAAPAMAAYLAGAGAHGEEAERANAHFVVHAFEAFTRACPPLRGLQWSSALELALRSLSWGWALSLVAATKAADEIADERWERLFASWAEAMRYVAAHDSRYSSANNHRLGEAAGLCWAGHALSFLPEAVAWRARGIERLEDAFLAQTTEHGLTREHAFAYQQFVLDFVVSVEAVAVRAGRALPDRVKERIERVAESLDAISPGRGAPWAVGDGDEGRALHLAEPFEERVLASLACAFALVGRADDVPEHARALWLGLGTEGMASASAPPLPAVAPAPHAAGTTTARVCVRSESLLPRGAEYAVERWRVEGREARLLFDAAPLGMAPLYAHGHADALMVLLDVDGPRLVDPGTGAYHSDPALRNRLRATRAHNTVEIDGESQSRPGGLFQWFDPAPIVGAGVEHLRDGGIHAGHRGYHRLGARLFHHRIVRVLEPDVIAIVDQIHDADAAQARKIVLRWHVGDGVPEAVPDHAGHALVRWSDGFELTLIGEGGAGEMLAVGAPVVWAPRFLEPRPCGVLELAAECEGSAQLVTVIAFGRASLEPAGRSNEDRVVRTAHGTVAIPWLEREATPRL